MSLVANNSYTIATEWALSKTQNYLPYNDSMTSFIDPVFTWNLLVLLHPMLSCKPIYYNSNEFNHKLTGQFVVTMASMAWKVLNWLRFFTYGTNHSQLKLYTHITYT